MKNERMTIHAFGVDETVAKISYLVGKTGASGIEVQFDRADGPPLQDGEEITDDEAIMWRVVASYPKGHALHPHVIGMWRARAKNDGGGDHRESIQRAFANLATELGANVTIVGGS